MKKKYTTLTAVALTLALSASAVPAKKGLMTVTQPDGTTITIKKVGDERMHFTLSDDDKLLIQDVNGQFSYANIDEKGALKSTGIKAVNAAVRPAAHANYLKSINDIQPANVQAKRLANARRKSVAQSGMGTFTSNFPKSGKIKGLVLLVEYSDVKFKTTYNTSAKQYFNDLIKKEGFSEYGASGSATDYFKYCSYGQFLPEFDVIGPIQLPQKRSYYGGNDSNGNDNNPERMVVDACRLIDSDVNFADYDNDGDGEVDNVYVIYAGVGEASRSFEDSVWPHSWNVSYGIGYKLTYDNVKIDRYACSNEWNNSSNKPDGIGTFVHEFSHVMGLPDLYDTTYSHSSTPNDYSIMDYGSYNNDSRTPPAYSSFERLAMGWIDPTVLDGADVIALQNLANTNQACIIQTSNTNEFFMLENRQQTGWDRYIPNHGMIIWHIDFNQSVWDSNSVNNTKAHQYVDIVEANNNSSSTDENKKGWTWPGTTGKTSFTPTSVPALKDWSGNAVNIPITDIVEENGVITFNVCGGTSVDIPTLHNAGNLEKSEDYFVAQWDPVDGATDYKVWVYAVADENINKQSVRETESTDMGTVTSQVTLPDGWTSSTLGTYTSAASAGESVPSAKLKEDGSYIQTRKYDNDVVEISFWMKGMATNSSSVLRIEGLIDGIWQNITDVTPQVNKATTETITDIPEGVKQVRFAHQKSWGNIALDDIKITTDINVKDEVLADYNGVLTGGATSLRVDKLKAGCHNYKFAVAATDNGRAFTKASNFEYLNLITTGVSNISAADDNNALSIEACGNTITVSTSANQVEIFDALGRHIATQRVVDGRASISLANGGMYIVRANGETAKIVLR
jgi:M6 family metalloprotease-like protein